MATNSMPNRPNSQNPPHVPVTNMAPPGLQTRRSRPAQVQTSLPSQLQNATAPISAISGSSAASSSHPASPITSPEAAIMTSNSSLQVSPAPSRGTDTDEPFPIAPLQLPDSVLTHKASTSSLRTSLNSATSPTSMADALNINKQQGIIRRISNRAQRFASRRRQSSATPNSRDGSVGPGMLRRRSDSNNTLPPLDTAALLTDSDDDLPVDKLEMLSPFVTDGTTREPPPTPLAEKLGPSIPLQLVKGTWVRKVSSKTRGKRFILVLESEAGRISWDKARPQKFIYIDDIKEIRYGPDIRQYRLSLGLPESDESRWFTLIYCPPDSRAKTKLMHLIADDYDTLCSWVTTLYAISQHRQDWMASLMAFNDKAVESYWIGAMKKKWEGMAHRPEEEVLDLAGVETACFNLHIFAEPDQVKSKFHAALPKDSTAVNLQQFKTFVDLMKRRHDILEIYSRFASNPEQGMTCFEFLDFLRDIQGEDVESDQAGWKDVYVRFTQKYSKIQPSGGSPQGEQADDSATIDIESLRMSDHALSAYLTSTDNAPLIPPPAEVKFDRPMHEYYISSSHNTYLLGRQVAGSSSIEGYITALVRGCRCVEIDCWNGNDGQPIVLHGRTMTSSISFEQVIVSINKYAFASSPYPLWISLEVHCNPVQQEIMAIIMKKLFGDKLVTEPLDPSSDKLPSPDELKGRILIKVKKPFQSKEDSTSAEPTGRRRGSSLSSPYIRPALSDNSSLLSQSLPQSPLLSPSHLRRLASVNKNRVNTINEGSIPDASSTSSDSESGSDAPSATRKSSNTTVKVLGELGVYCMGLKFVGFNMPEAKAFNHIFSFQEGSFAKHSKTKELKQALDIHNMRYLMRVYPDRTRIMSNNFNPLLYWRRGVQMAALNWQTFDMGMQLNQAMFAGGSDSSGYVLKPAELRSPQRLAGDWTGKVERKTVRFSIDVLSAQQLLRPKGMAPNRTLDPYVEVEVFHMNDGRDKKEGRGRSSISDAKLLFRTPVVRQNGFNPIFGSKFSFEITTKYPDLIFVRWALKLSSDGVNYNDRAAPVASFTAKLVNLKKGYRTLPLFDPSGEQYLFSTLFSKIDVESITSVMLDHIDEQPTENSKLKGIGRGVFSRTSPRSTMEKSGTEKSSFDGPALSINSNNSIGR